MQWCGLWARLVPHVVPPNSENFVIVALHAILGKVLKSKGLQGYEGYASQNGSLMIHFSPPRAYTNSIIVALDPGSLCLHGNTRLVTHRFDEPKG